MFAHKLTVGKPKPVAGSTGRRVVQDSTTVEQSFDDAARAVELDGVAPRLEWDFGKITVAPSDQGSPASSTSPAFSARSTMGRHPATGDARDPLVRNRVLGADQASLHAPRCACGGRCARCQQKQRNQTHQSLASARAVSRDRGRAEAPPIVHSALSSSGQPLESASRVFMERRFGHDFSRVRVHANASAADGARALGVRAYTVGAHIVFAPGEYRPGGSAGRRLLAHELAHVLQQSGGAGAPPGLAQEQDAETATNAVGSAARANVRATSGIGFAAYPVHLTPAGQSSVIDDPDDQFLGLKVVRLSEIEAKVDRILNTRNIGGMGRQMCIDAFRQSVKSARAMLEGTHFRDDDERLSFARCFFENLPASEGGDPDPVVVRMEMINYEVQVEQQRVDLVIHTPPTEEESRKLAALKQKRRAELKQREAERARQEAAAAQSQPEDLLGCPSPRTAHIAPGPYTDQGIVLPYDKLVPMPDPRVGYDEAEGQKTVQDPSRLEQLYYDALTGNGRAAWLICILETSAGQGAREAAHKLYDITTLKGLECTTLLSCGFNPPAFLSRETASGQRLLTVILTAFAREAFKLKVANGVVGNLLTLAGGAAIAKNVLAETATATGGSTTSARTTMAPPEDVKPAAPVVKTQTTPPPDLSAPPVHEPAKVSPEDKPESTTSDPKSTDKPDKPASTPSDPKSTGKAASKDEPATAQTAKTGDAVPARELRKELRKRLEDRIKDVQSRIDELNAAKGKVEGKIRSLNERLKTATGAERDQLKAERQALIDHHVQELGTSKDLGKELLDAKQLLRGTEQDYFNALSRAASGRSAYQAIKARRVDEVFGTKSMALEVEHIYPRSRIFNTPGFERLSWDEQVRIFNYEPNLKLMPEKANAARGNLPYRSWPKKSWSPFTSDQSVIDRWAGYEDKMQKAIEDMISNPRLIPPDKD